MTFVKVVKNKAYFKRFQVKYRRRREGKTDYRARKRLITQDKNKYDSPKFRFVVRFTNKDVICQIIIAKIKGDEVIASAYAHELKNYGLPAQLKTTNYAAAYSTGLLLARRILTKFGLAEEYKGQEKATGELYLVEEGEEKRPFKAFLDVGLLRTTTGNRVFGALKGACDGGMYVPHNEKRFIGYDAESKKLDSDRLRDYIFGGHVRDYMADLKEEDEAKYQKVFSKYIEAGIGPDEVEGMWEKVHQNIRAKPVVEKKAKKNPGDGKTWNAKKLTWEQRKARVAAKKAELGLPEHDWSE